MNVKGAWKAYHDYLEATNYEANDWQERALHAEAILEIAVRISLFGNVPPLQLTDGTVVEPGYTVTAEDIPDLSILDLDAPLTEDDLRIMEALAKRYGLS